MDLPAVLRGRPELCLIDELAHTNAPGVEHAKRYEDVEDVLAAGIDVLSTVNVQHLESLNDQVAELTGVRVRETIPDSVLARADEVVLVDLTPEALLERLRAGKVYPRERIDAALNNFFRIENLAALREVALRQVAEEVEAKRRPSEVVSSREESLAEGTPQAVGERLLALVEPYPGSQRLVRRAWRSAQRLGADLDLLWVRKPGQRLEEDNERSLTALRQLAAMLGAKMYEEEADDVAAAVADFAARQGTTYILLGRSRPREGGGALSHPAAAAADGAAARASTCGSSPTAPSRQNGEARISVPGDHMSAPADHPDRGRGRADRGRRRLLGCPPTAAAHGKCAPRRRSGGSCFRSPARPSRGARSRRRSAWPRPRTQ